MTEQERQLIESLAARLRNSPTPEVNPEAEDLIRRTIASKPHALYILTQTVLLQEIALNQAKAKATPPPSFLGDAAPAGNWGRDGRLNAGSGFGGAYRGSSYQTGVPPAPPPVPQQTWARCSRSRQAGWCLVSHKAGCQASCRVPLRRLPGLWPARWPSVRFRRSLDTMGAAFSAVAAAGVAAGVAV